MRIPASLKNRRGISLIEVIVALVIFVVGILTVVRMFPGGFLTVRRSENVTIADRLAQAELERWRNRASNLPSGILPWGLDEATGIYTEQPDADADNIHDSIPPHGRHFSDVNKFRRVHSEATKIPVPSSSSWGAGSVYVLGFSPVFVDAENSIAVYSGPMRSRSLPTNRAYLRLRGYSQYAIDYDKFDGDGDAAAIYVRPASYSRVYYISYSYWLKASGPTPELVSEVRQRIDLPPASQNEQDQGYQMAYIPDPASPASPLKDRSGFEGINRGSESLHRGFVELTTNTGLDWSSDPYEFRLQNVAVGIVLFNPNGYGAEELTARGREPLVAYLDYTVLDWHIISEERRVAADGSLKLSLRFLKEMDITPERDGSMYGGISALRTAYLPYSILLVDLATGDVYTDPPGPSGAVFTTDYKDGVLKFQPAYAGRTFRVYYQADGDWAVQTFKAYDSFRLGRSGAAHLQYDEYHFNPTAGDYTVGFKRCHAGNTVAIDYKYTVDGEERTVRGEACQVPLATGSFNLCYIDLLDKLATRHPTASSLVVTDISQVYGISTGVKVIWRESARGFRAGRWKQKEIQTCLVRANE